MRAAEGSGTRGGGGGGGGSSDGDGDSGGRKGWERGIAKEEERAGGHSLAAGVGIRSAPTTRVRKILLERTPRRRKTLWCLREGGRQRGSGEDRGRERKKREERKREKEGEGRRKKKKRGGGLYLGHICGENSRLLSQCLTGRQALKIHRGFTSPSPEPSLPTPSRTIILHNCSP